MHKRATSPSASYRAWSQVRASNVIARAPLTAAAERGGGAAIRSRYASRVAVVKCLGSADRSARVPPGRQPRDSCVAWTREPGRLSAPTRQLAAERCAPASSALRAACDVRLRAPPYRASRCKGLRGQSCMNPTAGCDARSRYPSHVSGDGLGPTLERVAQHTNARPNPRKMLKRAFAMHRFVPKIIRALSDIREPFLDESLEPERWS